MLGISIVIFLFLLVPLFSWLRNLATHPPTPQGIINPVVVEEVRSYVSDGTFETQIKKLINEDDENGPIITNEYLAILAENSIQKRYASPNALEKLLNKGDAWLVKQIKKENAEEEVDSNWKLLA